MNMTGRRTFRPSAFGFWKYPVGLLVITLLLGCVLGLGGKAISREWIWAVTLLITGFVVIVWKSVSRFYLKVMVDEEGLRWHDGEKSHELAWTRVQKLDWDPRYPGIHIAVLEHDGSRPHALPFITPALYEALRGRLGPLPDHVEARIRRGEELETVPGP